MQELIGKTPAEHLAAQLQGSARSPDEDGPIFRLNLRLPASTFALVGAFAEYSDRTKNYIGDQLMVVGAQAVLEAMPEAQRDAVQLRWLQLQSELLAEERE